MGEALRKMKAKAMDIMKRTPKNPDGWRCDGCKKWFREGDLKSYGVTPKGVMETSEALRQGIKIMEGSIVRVAACTTSPQWVATTDDNWCWQYIPRLEQ